MLNDYFYVINKDLLKSRLQIYNALKTTRRFTGHWVRTSHLPSSSRALAGFESKLRTELQYLITQSLPDTWIKAFLYYYLVSQVLTTISHLSSSLSLALSSCSLTTNRKSALLLLSLSHSCFAFLCL
jgi:hypothetical protein